MVLKPWSKSRVKKAGKDAATFSRAVAFDSASRVMDDPRSS
jgi:hypothetical protein